MGETGSGVREPGLLGGKGLGIPHRVTKKVTDTGDRGSQNFLRAQQQLIPTALMAQDRGGEAVPCPAGSHSHLHPEYQSLSWVQLFATPWTIAHQAPLSMGFSRQEYWSG